MTLPPNVTGVATTDPRELALQVALRLVALLRTGRSYPLGSPVLAAQYQQLLSVLAPLLETTEDARLFEHEGDLWFDEHRLPLRPSTERALEHLQHELLVRQIVGLRFRAGIGAPELHEFMRFFLPSELYKGAELARACAAQGVTHVTPLLASDTAGDGPAADPDVPAAYRGGLEAFAHAAEDLRALLAPGLRPGVESRHLRRAVQPLVDAALAGDAVTAPLADLLPAPQERWLDGLHQATLVIATGAAVGMQRGDLARVAAAALLAHATPAQPSGDGAAPWPEALPAILRDPRCFTHDRIATTALHAALARQGTARVVLPSAALLAIAETWCVLATREDARGPLWTPTEALGLVLGPLAGRFHPSLRTALLHALGPYPPGQMVELDDGSVARVAACDPRAPERPFVEPVAGPDASALVGRAGVAALPAARSIARAVPFARRAA